MSQLIDWKQAEKATKALVKHLEKESESKKKPNLLESDPESSVNKTPIYVVVSLKKFLTDQRSLKPRLIQLPHSLYDENDTACLFVKDPQRTYKDELESLKPKLERIVGISKLKGKFKPFEARRLLRDTHSIFLADDRVIPLLPKLLGKSFYQSTNTMPIGISLSSTKGAKDSISVKHVEGEINKAFQSTSFTPAPGTCFTIKIGYSTFSTEQLIENYKAVVEAFIGGKRKPIIKDGEAGLQSLYIKSSDSTSLPVYVCDNLITDASQDILTPGAIADADNKKIKSKQDKNNKKRKERSENVSDSKQQDDEKDTKKLKKSKAKSASGPLSKHKAKAVKAA